MIIPIQKDQLSSYFPYPCEIIPTTGIGGGVIVKFETFYLKIYNDINENHYIIEEYQYGNESPININSIHINKMREYAYNLFN